MANPFLPPALPGWHWWPGDPRSCAFTRLRPCSCAFTPTFPSLFDLSSDFALNARKSAALPGWHWGRGNPRSGPFTRASPSSGRASLLGLRPCPSTCMACCMHCMEQWTVQILPHSKVQWQRLISHKLKKLLFSCFSRCFYFRGKSDGAFEIINIIGQSHMCRTGVYWTQDLQRQVYRRKPHVFA